MLNLQPAGATGLLCSLAVEGVHQIPVSEVEVLKKEIIDLDWRHVKTDFSKFENGHRYVFFIDVFLGPFWVYGAPDLTLNPYADGTRFLATHRSLRNAFLKKFGRYPVVFAAGEGRRIGRRNYVTNRSGTFSGPTINFLNYGLPLLRKHGLDSSALIIETRALSNKLTVRQLTTHGKHFGDLAEAGYLIKLLRDPATTEIFNQLLELFDHLADRHLDPIFDLDLTPQQSFVLAQPPREKLEFDFPHEIMMDIFIDHLSTEPLACVATKVAKGQYVPRMNLEGLREWLTEIIRATSDR